MPLNAKRYTGLEPRYEIHGPALHIYKEMKDTHTLVQKRICVICY